MSTDFDTVTDTVTTQSFDSWGAPWSLTKTYTAPPGKRFIGAAFFERSPAIGPPLASVVTIANEDFTEVRAVFNGVGFRSPQPDPGPTDVTVHIAVVDE